MCEIHAECLLNENEKLFACGSHLVFRNAVVLVLRAGGAYPRHERGVSTICVTLHNSRLQPVQYFESWAIMAQAPKRILRASALCNAARIPHRGVALAVEKHSALAYGA